MKKIIFLFCFVLIELSCFSQNMIAYQLSYDNTGNCVYRGFTYANNEDDTDSDNGKRWCDSIYEEVLGCKISLFPNPTEGVFSVEISPCKETVTAFLTNVGGTIIIIKEINGLASFDIHDKPSGIYILKIFLNGKEYSWKVIKH